MATRKRLDLNQLAKSIVDQATGEVQTPIKVDGRSAGGKSRMGSLTKDEIRGLSNQGVLAKQQAAKLVAQAAKKTRISV